MNRHSFVLRFGPHAASAACLPCRAMLRTAVYAVLVFVVARASPAWADILYDPFSTSYGQVIPGTQGITPGPGVDLSGWNTPGHELEFAILEFIDLTNASFANSDLTNASFDSSTLTNANFSSAIVKGANFSSTTFTGFTASQLYSTASYASGNLTGIGLEGNDLTG